MNYGQLGTRGEIRRLIRALYGAIDTDNEKELFDSARIFCDSFLIIERRLTDTQTEPTRSLAV